MVSSESLQRGWEFTAEKGNPPRSGLPDFIQGAQYGDRSLHLHAMGRIRDRQRGNEGLGRLAGRHAGGSQGGRRSMFPLHWLTLPEARNTISSCGAVPSNEGFA